MKSTKSMFAKKKKSHGWHFPNNVTVFYSVPNQQWFVLMGDNPSTMIILEKFRHKADALAYAERITSPSGARDPGKKGFVAHPVRPFKVRVHRALTHLHGFSKSKADHAMVAYASLIHQAESSRRSAVSVAKTIYSFEKSDVAGLNLHPRRRDPGTLNDHRGPRAHGQHGHGYVIATDSFLSGWGGAAGGKSVYAIEVQSENEGYIVMDNMKHRSEMKRVRWVKTLAAVKKNLGPRDHLTVSDKHSAPRFFQPGGFAENYEKKLNAGRRRDPETNGAWDADELLLYIDNDYKLYNHKKAFLKNAYAKMKKGTYKPELAVKLWAHYVEMGAKAYAKDFGGTWHKLFPVKVRHHAAEVLAKREAGMLHRGEYAEFPALG